MDTQWKEVHLLAKKCLRPPEAGGGVGLEQIIPSSLQGECGPAPALIPYSASRTVVLTTPEWK